MHSPKVNTSQQGAILIVCMLMLLLVTLIGVGTMDLTTREVKMAVAMQDGDRAFESAEVALSEAECWIEKGLDPFDSECGPNSAGGNIDASGDPQQDAGIGNVWEEGAQIGDTDSWWLDRNESWWEGRGTPVAGFNHSGLSQQSNANPKYIIELVSIGTGDDSLVKKAQGDSSRQFFYRITARATGARDSTVVLLQSTYGKR